MIKSLLGATFFVSTMLFAQTAQASTACSNVNLYQELSQTDPASYAKITAQANDTKNGRGIFWKVSHKDSDHVSWLFGTMHKSDPRVTSLPNNVITALETVDTFAGELDSAQTSYEMGLIIGGSPELMFQQDGQKLSDKLSPDTVAQVDLILNERGSDFDQIDPMQAWLSASMLAFSLCDVEMGMSDINFLDVVMENDARKAGKTIVGLETVREQIDAISNIDPTFFYKSLDDAAQQYRDGVFDDILQTATELYLDEEIGVMLPLMMHYSHSLKIDDADMLSFQTQLLDDRNKGMVEKSAELFEQGPTFVAIGALHLVGETGLVEGLRNKGYAVERVMLER
ncbi:TraB/GumN family protein [Maritalea sp.]|uniref:TraB/GumN family protein n=1 Tax=Maritalea sp. TaxID=2003361 RepID=UPI003EF0F24A